MSAAGGIPVKRCFQNGGQVYYGDGIETPRGSCLRHGHGRQLVTAMTVGKEQMVVESYEGRWINDKMAGHGCYRWMDGTCYEGNMTDGMPSGHGKLRWPEGSVYDGLWAHGEMSGQGTFYDAYDGLTVQGLFRRNCFLQRDGVWRDVKKQREQHRSAWLRIGGGKVGPAGSSGRLGPERELAEMPVLRCDASKLLPTVNKAISEGRVPLVFAAAGPGVYRPKAGSLSGSSSPAPLSWLESERGCTAETTVHVAFAALEKSRQRDAGQLFKDAIREALVRYRPFVLVFAAGEEGVKDPELYPMPKAWSLSEFFDRHLPTDLFDLDHFHSSGAVDDFLPPELQGSSRNPLPEAPEAKPEPPPVPETVSSPEPKEAPKASGKKGKAVAAAAAPVEDPEPQEPPPPSAVKLLPPTIYLLRMVLVSLERLKWDLSDARVREQVAFRFGETVLLHRVSVVLARGEI